MDRVILDMQGGQSASGFGHPSCRGGTPPEEILKKVSQELPTGPRR